MYFSAFTVRVIKLIGIVWMEHVARKVEMRIPYTALARGPRIEPTWEP
jgi:hypothetical protein